MSTRCDAASLVPGSLASCDLVAGGDPHGMRWIVPRLVVVLALLTRSPDELCGQCGRLACRRFVIVLSGSRLVQTCPTELTYLPS